MKHFFIISLSLVFLSIISIKADAEVCVKESSFHGLKTVVMESDTLKLAILPERGANIISMYDKKTNREWVWQNPSFKYKKPKYDDSFLDYDMSGYDDCFPTIGREKCFAYPWKDVVMPDHGEVWTLPWKYRVEKGKILLSVHGVRFPYILEKQVSFDEKCLSLTLCYRATNLSPMDMPVIWCGHYMSAVTPGMEAFFTEDVEFTKNLNPWSLEHHDQLSWVKFGKPETKIVAKFISKELSQGYAGFYDPATKDYLLYTFSVEKLPYLGLWINQRGFPFPESEFYHAGLEPTNGLETPGDSQKAGLLKYLKAYSSMEWQIRITFGKAERKKLYDAIMTLQQKP
jgi:hypothetical protein